MLLVTNTFYLSHFFLIILVCGDLRIQSRQGTQLPVDLITCVAPCAARQEAWRRWNRSAPTALLASPRQSRSSHQPEQQTTNKHGAHMEKKSNITTKESSLKPFSTSKAPPKEKTCLKPAAKQHSGWDKKEKTLLNKGCSQTCVHMFMCNVRVLCKGTSGLFSKKSDLVSQNKGDPWAISWQTPGKLNARTHWLTGCFEVPGEREERILQAADGLWMGSIVALRC